MKTIYKINFGTTPYYENTGDEYFCEGKITLLKKLIELVNMVLLQEGRNHELTPIEKEIVRKEFLNGTEIKTNIDLQKVLDIELYILILEVTLY